MMLKEEKSSACICSLTGSTDFTSARRVNTSPRLLAQPYVHHARYTRGNTACK